MATAYFKSAGVKQMLGYVVDTWFGYAGWGVNEYFIDQPGRYTFNEAFFANQVSLDWNIAEYKKRNPQFNPSEVKRLTAANKDIMGLLYDRLTVAFYGDPAWEARTMPGKCQWEQKLESEGNKFILTITPEETDKEPRATGESLPWENPRPIVQWFPKRIKNPKIIEGEQHQPTVTDSFLLIPRSKTVPPMRISVEHE